MFDADEIANMKLDALKNDEEEWKKSKMSVSEKRNYEIINMIAEKRYSYE